MCDERLKIWDDPPPLIVGVPEPVAAIVTPSGMIVIAGAQHRGISSSLPVFHEHIIDGLSPEAAARSGGTGTRPIA